MKEKEDEVRLRASRMQEQDGSVRPWSSNETNTGGELVGKRRPQALVKEKEKNNRRETRSSISRDWRVWTRA
eukprot:719236-Rhodomonas_salina.1